MSLATITFWNESSDSYGIPNILHSYLVSVFINQVIGSRDKIVKIVPLTENSPRLSSERPFIVKNSTKEQAIAEAFNVLKEMPTLKELESSGVIIKTEEKSPQLVSNW
jgi:hypothetical protein